MGLAIFAVSEAIDSAQDRIDKIMEPYRSSLEECKNETFYLPKEVYQEIKHLMRVKELHYEVINRKSSDYTFPDKRVLEFWNAHGPVRIEADESP